MSEWISAKDKLPEKHGWYLTAHKKTYPTDSGMQICFFCHGFFIVDKIKITHWRPLPEYPESEDDAGRVTNEEIKKALEAVMHLREFCYTQDECKDCIFAGDNDFCILGLDEPTSWQTDDLLTDAAHWMPLPELPAHDREPPVSDDMRDHLRAYIAGAEDY